MLGTTIASAVVAASLGTALVTTDQAVLRAAPRDAAQQQAQLWQGELLDIRGERLDYLQVWDHRRERGGYVKASQVKRMALAAPEAPDLLAVLRFVKETPGSESLAIGLAAAYLQAAPAEVLRGEAGVEALDALGLVADRLAKRASGQAALGKNGQVAVAAHLEVAARYGVKFASYEQEGQVRICYEGEAFRRVLAMSARPDQKARAALALTQAECMDPEQNGLERHQANLWRADVLERVEVATLSPVDRNRIAMRRAAVWSTIAYERARQGQPADTAAQRAIAELTRVQRAELTDDDQPLYNDAAMRVNASRWAALPAAAATPPGARPSIVTEAGQPGETCVLLVDAKNDARNPLARRCTYALVWPQSASLNREGNALALAVQPLEAWRELWLFRKAGKAWTIEVLPPASLPPALGYAEFAGWVPGGQQVLVAREARGDGKYKRNYEVLSLDSLVTQRQTGDPQSLGPFQRWQDPAWKRMSVSLR